MGEEGGVDGGEVIAEHFKNCKQNMQAEIYGLDQFNTFHSYFDIKNECWLEILLYLKIKDLCQNKI